MRRVENLDRLYRILDHMIDHFPREQDRQYMREDLEAALPFSPIVTPTPTTTAEVDMERVLKAWENVWYPRGSAKDALIAAIAEYERQKGEGACHCSGSGTQRDCSPSQQSENSSSSTASSAASEMTDEELENAYRKQHAPAGMAVNPSSHRAGLRAVANAQRELILKSIGLEVRT